MEILKWKTFDIYEAIFRIGFKNVRSDLEFYGFASWEAMYDALIVGDSLTDRLVCLLEPRAEYEGQCYVDLTRNIFSELSA